MADPETTPESKPESTPETILTQEQVNVIVGKARTEERSKFSDYDKYKADSETLEANRQTQLTKEESLTEANVAAEKRIEALQEVNQAQVVLSDIRVKASQMGFKDPEDAVTLVDRSGIAFDSATQAVTGVEAALTTLLESKTYLKGDTTAVPVNTNGGPRQPVPAASVTLDADQREMAGKLGISPDRYAAALGRGPGTVKPLPEKDDKS